MMLIFGKTLIVLVDAQELRRIAFANLFNSLLSGKNVLLLDSSSVEAIGAAQIFPEAMKNTAPLFILTAGVQRLADPRIAREIAVLRLLMPKCLVLVMVEDDWHGEVEVAVSLAINGVVCMSMPPRDVIAAIEIVLTGGTYFPKTGAIGQAAQGPMTSIAEDAVALGLSAAGKSREPADDSAALPRIQIEEKLLAGDRIGDGSADPMNLSRRQIEVLKTLQSGLSNKEIARSLGLSEATIKIHVSHLMRKFGVANRTQVAVSSRQGGLPGPTASPAERPVPTL